MFMHRAALIRYFRPQPGKRFLQPGRTIDDQEFGVRQTPGNEIIAHAKPGGFALAAQPGIRGVLTNAAEFSRDKLHGLYSACARQVRRSCSERRATDHGWNGYPPSRLRHDRGCASGDEYRVYRMPARERGHNSPNPVTTAQSDIQKSPVAYIRRCQSGIGLIPKWHSRKLLANSMILVMRRNSAESQPGTLLIRRSRAVSW